MRKKLITGAIVAAALAVPATPAFAIHDPTSPQDVERRSHSLRASAPNSQAVGNGTAHNPLHGPNLGVSNNVLA